MNADDHNEMVLSHKEEQQELVLTPADITRLGQRFVMGCLFVSFRRPAKTSGSIKSLHRINIIDYRIKRGTLSNASILQGVKAGYLRVTATAGKLSSTNSKLSK